MNRALSYFLFALIAVGIIFRIYGAYFLKSDLSHDESVSYQCASAKEYDYVKDAANLYDTIITSGDILKYYKVNGGLQFGKIASDLAVSDIHPPLYFWLLHVVHHLLGLELYGGLIINHICFLILLLILYRTGLKFFADRLSALLCCAVFALSPAVMQIDFEARPYQLFALFALMHYYISYSILVDGRWSRTWLLGLVLITGFGVLTHYYFLFLLLPFVAIGYYRFKFTRRFWILILTQITGVGVFLVLHPSFLVFISKYLSDPGQESAGGYDTVRVKVFIYTFLQYFSDWHYLRYLFLFLFSVLCAWFLVKVYRRREGVLLQVSKAHLLLYLGWYLLFTFLFYIFGITPGHAAGEQYLSYIWPLFTILLVFMIRYLFPKGHLLIFAAFLLQLAAAGYHALGTSNYTKKYVTPESAAILNNCDLIYFNELSRAALPRFCLKLEPQQQILIGRKNNSVILSEYKRLAVVEFIGDGKEVNEEIDALKKQGYSIQASKVESYNLYILSR